MLVFVTCVKHPDDSQAYNKVWQMLNNTLYSVCSQQDTNFRVIVVCDKKLPLFHHHEQINKYTDFIQVSFPSHGEDVLNNFKDLGNLSPPLEAPQWWEIENNHQTALDLFGSSGPSFFMQMLVALVGKDILVRLRETKSKLQALLRGGIEAKLIKNQDFFHIANVVLNMGTKFLVGILTAKKYNPEYLMFFDADDYVGNDISAYTNSHPGENGWIMAHGYRMAGKYIAPYYRWNSVCGTGNIYNYPLLLEFIGNKVTEMSTQNEFFKNVDSEFLITIGRHDRPRKFFSEKARALLEYPTRSVIQLVDHDESSEFKRKIIRGEQAGVFLKNARKFGAITPISSTLISYFSILPNNATKVFCLGFQKTGTTSIEWVLQDMGYQVAKAYKQSDAKFSKMLENRDLSEIKRVSELFDAFQDIPWFIFYKEFDQWYPNSKFILTIRDSASWWNSFLRYFRTEYYPLFRSVYGFNNPVGHKEGLVSRFEKHNHEVIQYFINRPDDLLVIDVGEKRALEKVSKFLGKETSYDKMPHKNALLNIPVKDNRNTLKRRIKGLRNMHLVSFLKSMTFSAPPIMIVGSRNSGAEQLLSILSCHPHIHVMRNVKLTHPTSHPLTPEADRKKDQENLVIQKSLAAIDKKNLLLNLLSKPILFSAKRWAGVNVLGVFAFERMLAQFGKSIRIINIVRDGRDVILESDKNVLGKPVVSPERWVYDIRASIEFEAHSQVITVRYEDLVEDYENTILRICTFVGEADPSPFLSYPKGATMIEAGYWIKKWDQSKYSDRIGQLLETPDALKYLRHYGYID